MRLTPIDLLHREFRHTLRGYAPAQVDDLLREVAADLEECLAENAKLRDDAARLAGELERFRAMESTLKEALLLAQRAADDARNAARAEGEAIVSEARREAAACIEAAARDVQELQHRRLRLAAELRAWLLAEVAALDELPTADRAHPRHAAATAAPTAVVAAPASDGDKAQPASGDHAAN